MVPSFRCPFLPDMPPSPTPGSLTSIYFQNFDANIGLRRMTTGSALPTLPQSVPRGRSISWLHWFTSATACQVACPPVRIRLQRPAFGDFYFQAFDGSVSLPVAGYNYNSDWTPLLAGLPPAGMAASFAARPFSTKVRCGKKAIYLITLSARISRLSGTDRPMSFAVALVDD